MATNISSWTDLNNIRYALGGNYILTKNLSSSDPDYVGIGDSWVGIGTDASRFTGVFDGDGYTISDVVNSGYRFGFFGHSHSSAIIKNLNLDNITCTSGSNTNAGLIAINIGTIFNCHILNGNIGNGTGSVAGVCGRNDGTIYDCSCNAVVCGEYAGGFVVYQYGTIYNCHCSGSVQSLWTLIAAGGGFAVSCISGLIHDCYTTSSCNLGGGGGGFCSSGAGTIYNCFSSGSHTVVIGKTIGGFSNQGLNASNCYWIRTASINPSLTDTAAGDVSYIYTQDDYPGGANNIWIGSGNWSNTSNWLWGILPLSGGSAIFDDTSIENCNIDVDVNVETLIIQSNYTGTITHAGDVHISSYFKDYSNSIVYNQAYEFTVGGYSIWFNIVDMHSTAGEDFIEELNPGPLNPPLDILFSQRLQTDFIEEYPLGPLNAPIDELWDVPEIGEMDWYTPPVLNAPLDITMGNDNEDLLFYNLVLTGGGEISYAFVV